MWPTKVMSGTLTSEWRELYSSTWFLGIVKWLCATDKTTYCVNVLILIKILIINSNYIIINYKYYMKYEYY